MRLGIVPLADPPFLVGARGVEVAQRHRAEPAIGVEIGEDLLDHQLAAAIGVDGRLPMLLGHRRGLRHAVGRAGRREHELVDARVGRDRQQADRAAHVVVIEGERIEHRLPDLDQRGEMNDRLRLVPGDDVAQAVAVVQVAGLERPPSNELLMPVGQIVIDDR